jgi:hypothetical protein
MVYQIVVLVGLLGVGAAQKGCAPGNAEGRDVLAGRIPPDGGLVAGGAAGGGGGGGTGTATVTGNMFYSRPQLGSDLNGNIILPPNTITPQVRLLNVVALDPATLTEIQQAPAAIDDIGNFSLLVPRTRSFFIGLLSTTSNSRSRVDLELRDPTQPGFPLYLYLFGTSGTFAVGTNTGGLAPFTTGPDQTSLAAGNFALFTSLRGQDQRDSAIPTILEAGLRASDRVRGVTNQVPPRVTFFYSVNATPAQVPGTFYTTTGPLGGPSIFINLDDEYDDSVIIHEYGHHTQESFSKDNSLGGIHFLNQASYPALGFSEGFANFFAGAVDSFPIYIDSFGLAFGFGLAFTINLEGGRAASSVRGIRNEETVGEILWDIIDGTESRPNSDNENNVLTFTQLFAAMRALRGTATFLTLIAFLDALVATGAITAAQVSALLAAPENQIVTFNPPVGQDVHPTDVLVGANVTDTCVTRTTFFNATGRDESNRFFRLTLASLLAVTVRISSTDGSAGTNATGTNLDLFLLDTNSAPAAVSGGTTPTAFEAVRPEGAIETVTGVLNSGAYILWVNGRASDLATRTLQNTSSNTVTYQLQVTSP